MPPPKNIFTGKIRPAAPVHGATAHGATPAKTPRATPKIRQVKKKDTSSENIFAGGRKAPAPPPARSL